MCRASGMLPPPSTASPFSVISLFKGCSLPAPKYSTMSAHQTPGHISRFGTPPSIPAKTLLLVHQVPELGEQQLREFLDRSVRDGCDIRHFYEVMIDAIRLNEVYLVKELLRCNIPISSIYVLEAVKGKAKDILAAFFDNGWDINAPMGGMDPPILA